MFLRIWIPLIYLILAPNLFAQKQFSGFVFQDNNSNGIFDPSEKGIQGICLSNGIDVVQTNSDGKWALNGENGGQIFVIKPAGYNVPVSKNQIPLHFEAANQSDAINFPLLKSEPVNRFSAIFFGDPQARGLAEVNYINHDVVEELIGTDALFGVTLGDITADGPDLFTTINEGIARIGIPWYNTFGNHDYDRDAKTAEDKDLSFRQTYGPSTYAFEYGQVVFIDFNNINFNSEGKNRPHFTENQIQFVKNYIRFVPKEKLVVLMMHVPIVVCDNKKEMLDLISDRKYTFSISGHVHEQMNLFVTREMGWNGVGTHHHLVNATVCGSWWCGMKDETGIPHATMNDGAPNGYSIITFDGNAYSVRFKAARRPESYQMNIYFPEEIGAKSLDSTKILVNVFAGSSRSKVEMSIDNFNVWRPLQQVKGKDPEIEKMHQLSPILAKQIDGKKLEDMLGYSMDEPSETDHLWQGKFQDKISAGTHTVHIKVTDMYGQIWNSHRIFRVKQLN